MFHRVPVRILSVAFVAVATTLSRAAGLPAPTLNEVLARAAAATAALAERGHAIVCQEKDRQTVVVDPPPLYFDRAANDPNPWAYRDIVATWSLTPPSPDGSDAWKEVRTVHSLEPFDPFPGKKPLNARDVVQIDSNIDVPAPLPRVAAVFLSAGNQPRFEFEKAGEAEVHGVSVWEVKFRETARRWLWRLPVSGSVWIEPSSGRVLRSALAVKGKAPFSDAMTVDYRLDPATDFYLPHRLTRRTHVTSERLWVETTGTLTGCRALPTSAH